MNALQAAVENPPTSAGETALSSGRESAPVVTVVEVFLRAGIPRAAFDAHLAAGRVVSDGQTVTDPATPVQRPGTVGVAAF